MSFSVKIDSFDGVQKMKPKLKDSRNEQAIRMLSRQLATLCMSYGLANEHRRNRGP